MNGQQLAIKRRSDEGSRLSTFLMHLAGLDKILMSALRDMHVAEQRDPTRFNFYGDWAYFKSRMPFSPQLYKATAKDMTDSLYASLVDEGETFRDAIDLLVKSLHVVVFYGMNRIWMDFYECVERQLELCWTSAILAIPEIIQTNREWSVDAVLGAFVTTWRQVVRVFSMLDSKFDDDDIFIPRADRGIDKASKIFSDILDALDEVIAEAGPNPQYAPLRIEDVRSRAAAISQRTKEVAKAQRVTKMTPGVLQAGLRQRQNEGVAGFEEEEDKTDITGTENASLKVSTRLSAQNSNSINSISSSAVNYIALGFAATLTALPGYKAWEHSMGEAGTTSDPDFWFLVQASLMQVLGIFSIVAPLLGERLHFRRWALFWTLVLTSCGCAGLSVVLYVSVATQWSAIVSWIGGVAQLFATLQAMFLVQKRKTA